jgi:two-component system response regulator YesN
MKGVTLFMEEIKVMVVDDEPLAIGYLKDIISWEDNGYKIVAQATDARLALQNFSQKRPQIVISDICMPGMNGLELCKGIFDIDSSAKIILLTAYSEFEYAKKAVEIGASSYILKHEINGETLLNELNKVRCIIEKERNTKDIIKKHILLNYIERSEEHKDNINEGWDILECKGKMFILLLLKPDAAYPILVTEKSEKYIDINMDEKIKSLYSKLSDGFLFVDSFKLRNNLWALLFSYKDLINEDCLLNRFNPIINETKVAFEETSGITFSIISQTSKLKVENITLMYREGMKAFSYLPLMGRSKTLNLKDLPYNQSGVKKAQTYDKMKQALRELSGFIYSQNLKKIDETLDNIFSQILVLNFDIDLLRLCCNEIIHLIDKCRTDNFISDLHEDEKIHAKTEECYSLKEIRNMFHDLIQDTFEKIMDIKFNKYSKKVQAAIKFLHNHYSQDISITDVAQEIEISESNLSRLYRNETGQSVIEYLTLVRINEAKKLLENSNYKIYEISEKVGYKTSQYFSQVFVKIVGMNPVEYRGGKNVDDKSK